MPGTGDLATVLGAIIGAGLGFLWFNAPPAKVFMGDTGSLALGGALGAVSVATRHELVLAIAGGLFVVETLSVILQIASFKLTGKRIFLMAPLHHHYELKGWPESTIVIRLDYLGDPGADQPVHPEVAIGAGRYDKLTQKSSIALPYWAWAALASGFGCLYRRWHFSEFFDDKGIPPDEACFGFY